MKTVLLVDDSALLTKTYSMVLRQKGYNVIEADSGTSGFEMARRHLPDLIITDVDMPHGDGTALLRNIRQDPELHSKQVVLMTGRPDLATPRKGMDEGADDFLKKPISLEVLVNCVEARFRRAEINWRIEDKVLSQFRSAIPPQLPPEFFTPMAGIIGLLDIMRADLSSFSMEEIADIHEEIYKSALRLNRTLKNYLLIVQLQNASSSSTPPLPTLKVEEGIQDGIHDTLRQNARWEDMKFKAAPCSLSIVSQHLRHIVEELVDNACKFSLRGTPIKIELSADGRLSVSDQGRGMTPERIKLVESFQQFDRKTSEQEGLGLGLVLVQMLAALYGAKFSIASQPGEGTRVELAFPLVAPH